MGQYSNRAQLVWPCPSLQQRSLACCCGLSAHCCTAARLKRSIGFQHDVLVACKQIFHAGEGGIYAELVQDRSFEGLAFTQQFLDSPEKTVAVGDLGLIDQDDHLSYYGIWCVLWHLAALQAIGALTACSAKNATDAVQFLVSAEAAQRIRLQNCTLHCCSAGMHHVGAAADVQGQESQCHASVLVSHGEHHAAPVQVLAHQRAQPSRNGAA